MYVRAFMKRTAAVPRVDAIREIAL